MINRILYKNQSLTKLIFAFIFSRLFSCSLIFLLLPLYDSRFFTFKDLTFYKEVDSGFFSPNFLFAYLVKFIRYDQSNIHDLSFLLIFFIISLIIFIPWIYLAERFLSKRGSFLYAITLGLHPYLALYSLKFDSTSFAILPVAFFTIEKLLKIKKLKYISLLISTLSTFFRSQVLIIAWLQLILFNSKKVFKISKSNLFIFIITIFLIICSIIQFNYGADILTQNFGCYSTEAIGNFFLKRGFGRYISNILSFLITPIVHVILLLGAREAIAANCINLPREVASIWQINIFSTLFFLFFNLYAVINFIKYIFKKRPFRLQLLIPFSILLPNLYGAAHMRYSICIVPYILLFIFKQQNNNNQQ